MFKLSQPEKDQVITICDHLKNLKYAKALPSAFTEHGTIMAASVLNRGASNRKAPGPDGDTYVCSV
jgi:hypothetical protein